MVSNMPWLDQYLYSETAACVMRQETCQCCHSLPVIAGFINLQLLEFRIHFV